MKNKTLLNAWVKSWKFHIVFYPIYAIILFGMLPELFEPSNENPKFVQIALLTAVILMGILGMGRFVWIWYKQNKW